MHILGKIPEGERRVDFIYSILRYDSGQKHSLRKEIAKLMGYELSELISQPEKIDISTGRPYGAVLEEIDKIGKEVVKEILMEVA
jgi:cobaltochelatase CobN